MQKSITGNSPIMKIGILTFHRAHNYGAVLQAYALVTYLKNIGHDAEIVDYRPESIEFAHGMIPYARIKKMSPLGKIKFLVKIFPFLLFRKKRANIFYRFIEELPTSSKIYTWRDKHIEGYDYLICGSDQIWNPKITNGLDPFYTAEIQTDAKYISYAVSSEIKPNQQGLEAYKGVLQRFSKISVRESLFKEQLQTLTNKKIIQVLDPVFLLSVEDWLRFSKKPFKEENYILVYQVKRDRNVLRYAQQLSISNDCKIMEITAEADFFPRKKRYSMLSPQQFVGAFANAKFVVTTSFHGTAFSVLFHKPVKTVLFNTAGDYRAIDLLNTIGLKQSTITLQSQGDIDMPILEKAWNLSNMIVKSKDFLSFND